MHMKLVKDIVIVIVLVGIAFVIYSFYRQSPPSGAYACTADAKICPDGTAVGREGPDCEFAACPNRDAMFEKEGVVTYANPGTPADRATFVYEAPGAPALTKYLAFDTESMCVTPTGTIACMALSAYPPPAFHGKRVRVTGIDRGADLLVRTLENVEARSTN